MKSEFKIPAAYSYLPINVFLRDLVVKPGLCTSMTVAKRMLKDGAIELDGHKMSPDTQFLLCELESLPLLKHRSIIKVGKHGWIRIIDADREEESEARA